MEKMTGYTPKRSYPKTHEDCGNLHKQVTKDYRHLHPGNKHSLSGNSKPKAKMSAHGTRDHNYKAGSEGHTKGGYKGPFDK